MKDTFGYLRKYLRYSIMIGLEILLLTCLIVLTMYAFVFQNDARKQLDVVVANREESLRLAEQLRDSSDDLTKMIRSYAATGDTRFLKYFYAILDIRDGKVKRPEKYEGFFWDYKVAEEKIFEPAVGPGKSMRKQLLEQGFTDEEFAFLTKAKRLSDELVELEEKAIKAMSGSSTADNDQGREYALQLLYGKEYHDSKKKIMLAIDDFIGVLNKRTAAEVEVHQDSLDSINQTLRALFAWSFFLVLALLLTIIKFQKKAVGDLNISLKEKTKEIHERERVETELRRNKDWLQITLNSIGDAVIATDINDIVTIMNPVAEELTGYKVAESVGKPLDDTFHIVSQDEREVPAKKILEIDLGGSSRRKDYFLVSKNQNKYLISSSAAPITGDNEELLGAILVFRDVTEERRLMDQSMQTSKMEAIGQLAGGVAHDFNNMLSGIFSSVELLRRKLPEDPKVVKYLDLIFDASKRSADLTHKLLSFARKQPAVSTAINAHDSILAAVEILKKTIDRRIDINIISNSESMMIIGDPSMIQSLFINLGINASHAMPDGGTINIECKTVDLDPVYCEVSPFEVSPGVFLDVEFCDSGSGIPKDVLPHIFEPFFTTKEQGKGTGLGLASVYGTVQQHEGAINVYSEEGVGTCFHLFFPIADDGAEVFVSEQQEDCQGSGLVLLVDDEPIVRVTAEALLMDMGFEVLIAEDGAEGVIKFKEHAEDIDLVLIDMVMPRMNGVDSFKAMRKINPNIRGVLASGFANEEEFALVKEVGFSEYIRKPYLRRNLCEILNKVFSGKQV